MKIEIKTPGRTFEFTPKHGASSFVIGTRKQDDVRIEDDPDVSAPHVRIERLGDDWSFTDQFSDAGTVHNDEKKYSNDLAVGDVLKLGQTEVRIVDLDESAKPERPAAAPFGGYDANDSKTAQAPSPYDRGNSDEYNRELREEARSSSSYGPDFDDAPPDRGHDPAGDESSVESLPPEFGKAMANAREANQRSTRVALVIVAGVVFALVAGIFGLSVAVESKESAGDDSLIMKEGPEPTTPEDFSAAVKALRDDDATPPHELLDELDELEGRAKASGHSIGWEFEVTRTKLSGNVYREVSQRYGDVSSKIGLLQRAEDYGQAQTLVNEFSVFLDASNHHDRAIRMLKLRDRIESWQETNERQSAELVLEKLIAMDEGLSRSDFHLANTAADRIHQCAILDDAQRKAIRAAAREYGEKADAAETPPDAPFDSRNDALPESPKNRLLPSGDRSALTSLSRLQYHVLESIRAGELDGRQFEMWQSRFEIEGNPKSSQFILRVSRGFEPGVVVEGYDRVNLSNLNPRLRLEVLRQYDELKLNDLVVLMVYAFHTGQMEAGAEIAFDIRQLDPESKAPLDEILAAKWQKPIPEGGFPERYGKVAPE